MKDLKQMELIPLTSSQEDTLANLSPSQVAKKVSKIRDTSGQSILDLSKNSDRLGLLEKMLVDTLNSVSTPLSRTWKVKTTPLGRLVFQLRASAPTTKEKESGSWPTPNARDWKDSINKVPPSVGKTRGHSLGMKVAERLWRTPDAHGGRGPSSEKRMKMKLDKKMPISLNDQVAHPNIMWPTPREFMYKDSKVDRGKSNLGEKVGGSLNPVWVEWLMGYPGGYTDLKHWETLSSRKS